MQELISSIQLHIFVRTCICLLIPKKKESEICNSNKIIILGVIGNYCSIRETFNFLAFFIITSINDLELCRYL